MNNQPILDNILSKYLTLEHSHSEPVTVRYSNLQTSTPDPLPVVYPRTSINQLQVNYRIEDSDQAKLHCQRNLDFFGHEIENENMWGAFGSARYPQVSEVGLHHEHHHHHEIHGYEHKSYYIDSINRLPHAQHTPDNNPLSIEQRHHLNHHTDDMMVAPI